MDADKKRTDDPCRMDGMNVSAYARSCAGVTSERPRPAGPSEHQVETLIALGDCIAMRLAMQLQPATPMHTAKGSENRSVNGVSAAWVLVFNQQMV